MAEQPHLADHELLLLGDAAGPRAGQTAAVVHLEACGECRARAQRLWDADARLRAMNTDEVWGPAQHGWARARLQARLAQPPPPSAWWPSDVVRTHPAVGVLLGVAALVVIVFLARPGEGPARATTPLAGAHGGVPPRALPIRSLTPGATVSLAAEELCSQIPWETTPIPAPVRAAVLRAYGMEQVPDHEYELDYLITPDLGGSPDPRNLWPEPYHSPVWNARVKDELESLLPQLVCEGKVDLRTAQRDIAVDWIAAYKKYFKTDRPIRQG